MKFTKKQIESFNPLNQVYVFNAIQGIVGNAAGENSGFNPLNQVYVFNQKNSSAISCVKMTVLIP